MTCHLPFACSKVVNGFILNLLLDKHLLFKNLKIKIYRTIILPVVLNGCEAWSLTFREEHRLRVFEHRVLRFEVRGGWRKLHNEELNNLYSSPNISRVITSRRMRWAGHVARMGVDRCVQGFGGVTLGTETTGETQA
jgi:hypothetical protein